MKRYDLLVIGSGPAGHHAAIQGAKLGKSVIVVEAQPRVGGTGLNTGTIPSKTLREGVLALRRSRSRAGTVPGSPERWDETLRALQVRCRHVVDQEVDVYRAQFSRNRVELLQGLASFVNPHRVRLEGPQHEIEIEADKIVIAVGSIPARSERVPIGPPTVVDTDSIFSLGGLPRSMIVAGGGVVGVEYACMFAALGVAVTLVDLRPRLLEFVDEEIAEALCYQMRDAGITLRLGEELERVTLPAEGGVEAALRSRKQLRAETLLYAVGRQGNTRGLNLGAAGLDADARGRILVDERYRTQVPHIYAVGDVVGFPGLASVSMAQGRLAACDAFDHPASAQRRLFPYGIYTIPEISFVGQTEAELTAAGVPYEVGIARYREIARGQIMGDVAGRLKLLFHRETGQLLGVHIIGEGAAELVHIGQAVLTFGGTIDYFLENVFNYPTLAECYQVAALAVVNRLGAAGRSAPPLAPGSPAGEEVELRDVDPAPHGVASAEGAASLAAPPARGQASGRSDGRPGRLAAVGGAYVATRTPG